MCTAIDLRVRARSHCLAYTPCNSRRREVIAGRGLGRYRNILERRFERASMVLGLRVTELQPNSCVFRIRLLKMGPGSDRVRVLIELMAIV
jgi:hypothetical protein